VESLDTSSSMLRQLLAVASPSSVSSTPAPPGGTSSKTTSSSGSESVSLVEHVRLACEERPTASAAWPGDVLLRLAEAGALGACPASAACPACPEPGTPWLMRRITRSASLRASAGSERISCSTCSSVTSPPPSQAAPADAWLSDAMASSESPAAPSSSSRANPPLPRLAKPTDTEPLRGDGCGNVENLDQAALPNPEKPEDARDTDAA